ncbi:low affinity immunoglobulin epsilon Fc receptor-like [Penaeus vannamei]|uniref:Mannose-binding lectin 1 n=1 Tax=Penaeus vannamei TaxID=6689 RepID=A0A4Y1JNY1_PENVA|nr:mannose-binding lectin 1 [Penaeus vannamei]
MSALRWLASLLATAALAAASTESCSETWISFGESSFLLSSGNASWFDAFTECHRLGGKLASIQSQRENDFLHGMLTVCGVDKAWIGLTDAFINTVFKWADKEDLTFLNFGPGEPSGSGDHASEDCVEMRQDLEYQWNDEYCMVKRRFLCRKSTE